ncbi:ATP synthase F1 subunit delta [Mycoplasmopsis verecunda]|uniref:ATP synthase subunit delta n=1 Tax=Mycoplasmopsis verecunda TaxID=171291 RepID=A0A1T4KKL7_9BACT|nr:ATP synthase F1 subunit delta [Mycoplasmopsis verecunda]WPB54266.1 ATP synthase F1 subunit delta [Mycoplasmopsis verecunda]SJZ42938.1 F-type H+-transporting ATPase subunit delta [Mycoplasmopsis verecunda]
MYVKRNVSAYAVAIYDLVKEQDKFKQVQSQFEDVKALFVQHPEFASYLGNDLIPEEERFKTIDLAFKNFDIIIQNLLKVIVQRRMTSYIVKIIVEYLKLSNNELKIRFAIVQSAFPLSEQQLDAIRQKVQSVTRRTVVLKNEVVPNLISGIKIVSKTEVLEMNLLHDLNKIKNEIIRTEKEKEV